MTASFFLELLRDRIDITRVPFSDRGSRLLVFKDMAADQLYIKLAERLTAIQPGLDTYRFRPAYIQDFCFIDGEGMPLSCHLTTYPHVLLFQTRLGEFSLAFHKRDTLAIGLPAGKTAGIRFRVSTQMWQEREDGGTLIAVRNLAYRTNGQVLKNELSLEREAYMVELVADSGDDVAIHLNIRSDLLLDGAPVPFSETLAAAERRWHDWFQRVPAVAEHYQDHYYYARTDFQEYRLTHVLLLSVQLALIHTVYQFAPYALRCRLPEFELSCSYLSPYPKLISSA